MDDTIHTIVIYVTEYEDGDLEVARILVDGANHEDVADDDWGTAVSDYSTELAQVALDGTAGA